jgi:hypothetical protein
VVICCCVITGNITLGFSELCTVCSMDDLFLRSVISTEFQVRYLLQLITADDSRVGYLARILSRIWIYSGMVTWFHNFTSA